MKRLNIMIAFLFTASVLMLVGCLKDKDYEAGLRGIDIDENIKILEIPGPADGFINVDLLGSDNDTVVNAVLIRLASEKPAENDIQVTIALDPAAVDAYNTEHGTSYEVPNANLYSIPSLTVTIPKGQREVYVRLSTRPNDLLGAEYALGFKIQSVSDPTVNVSGNFKTQVVGLTIRNQYDGSYSFRGQVIHPSLGGSFTDAGYPCGTFTLVTAGANSVDLAPAQPFGNGTIQGIFGVYPRFTIDPATNKITVTDAAGGLASVESFSDYDSRYDPTTRTLYVKWGWNGSRVAWDTLTYCGPR
ncbi:MAG: DUF1735 domain-containing protein [Flavisolibacter sp.]